MAKIDIKSAYKMVPVHLEDRYLLAMKWQDQVCGTALADVMGLVMYGTTWTIK